MTEKIQKKFESWNDIQKLSLDILKSVSNEQLLFTVGNNMGTLGEQFRHMCKVRFQYAEAIENKVLGETAEHIDPKVAQSKDALVVLWGKANEKLKNVLKNLNSDEIEINWEYWGEGMINVYDHLNYLMDHETLHNGQIIVYLRTHEITFPASWAEWGL